MPAIAPPLRPERGAVAVDAGAPEVELPGELVGEVPEDEDLEADSSGEVDSSGQFCSPCQPVIYHCAKELIPRLAGA